jgi:kynurenine formamidase
LYSHCGTHADAPVHFGVSGPTIDCIPLDQCMRTVWILDVPVSKPRALITCADLGGIEAHMAPDDGLLLRTGWSKKAGTPEYYPELPRIAEDLARWCAARRLPILGVEPQAVADPKNIEEITRIHRILLEAGVLIVEGLCNLDAITAPKVTLMVFPLKIADGDGAPVRAVALQE